MVIIIDQVLRIFDTKVWMCWFMAFLYVTGLRHWIIADCTYLFSMLCFKLKLWTHFIFARIKNFAEFRNAISLKNFIYFAKYPATLKKNVISNEIHRRRESIKYSGDNWNVVSRNVLVGFRERETTIRCVPRRIICPLSSQGEKEELDR